MMGHKTVVVSTAGTDEDTQSRVWEEYEKGLLAMEVESECTNNQMVRKRKKYKTKSNLTLEVSEDQTLKDGISKILSKRKYGVNVEDLCFAKKARMEELPPNSYLAKTAEQSRQAL